MSGEKVELINSLYVRFLIYVFETRYTVPCWLQNVFACIFLVGSMEARCSDSTRKSRETAAAANDKDNNLYYCHCYCCFFYCCSCLLLLLLLLLASSSYTFVSLGSSTCTTSSLSIGGGLLLPPPLRDLSASTTQSEHPQGAEGGAGGLLGQWEVHSHTTLDEAGMVEELGENFFGRWDEKTCCVFFAYGGCFFFFFAWFFWQSIQI